MNCYFGRFADDSCRGAIDVAHVIPQRTIKVEWSRANRKYAAWSMDSPLVGKELGELLDDPRNLVYACRYHHAQADFGPLIYEVPESVLAFADEFGLPVRRIGHHHSR